MEAKIGNARGSRTLNGILWILSVLSGTLLGIAGSFAVAVSAMSDYRQMYNQWIGTDAEITSKEAQENLAWIENSPWVVYFADENAQSDLLSWLLLALVALAIVFCAALITLCVQTGRLDRAADGSIQLNRFDRVWSEVLLLLGGGAAGGAVALAVPMYEIWFRISIKGAYTPMQPSDYAFGPSNTAIWILCISGMAVCILLALLCFVSLVKKLKARMFWEKSFFGGIVLSIYRGIASSDKTMVKVMAFLIGGMLLSMTWFGAVLVLAAVILCIPRLVRQFTEIRGGVREVKSGNLAYRIPVETDRRGNVGELGRLAKDINEISQASNLAVQNELKNQRMKTELISNVSHDLKTPLTSMVSYIDLMKQEGLDSPHAPEYLEILDEKTQRLRVLTEELFEAAKASSGDMPVRMEAIDLGSLISQSLGEMNERLAARKLEILVSNHCAQSTPVMNTAWNPKTSRPAGEECAGANVNAAPFDAAPFDAADGMTEGMRAGVQAAAAGGMDGAAVFDDGAAAGIASAGPRVMADGQLLWRVLENLLGNVSKYALPGSRVYLDIRRVSRKRSGAAGTAGTATSAGNGKTAKTLRTAASAEDSGAARTFRVSTFARNGESVRTLRTAASAPPSETAAAGISEAFGSAASAGTAANTGAFAAAGTTSADSSCSAQAENAANGFVLLEVKNISEEQLNISAEELMERFKRGDASRNTEGSGLGLAIARDLTKLMGGVFEITVDGDLFKASILLKQA